MDMLTGKEIAEASLADWRKLAQGLHARYLVDDFGTGARFVAAVGEAGDALGHHPSVSMGRGYVDLKPGLDADDPISVEQHGRTAGQKAGAVEGVRRANPVHATTRVWRQPSAGRRRPRR
jgi:Pterin 4 alpha carbinolamine dehydratase